MKKEMLFGGLVAVFVCSIFAPAAAQVAKTKLQKSAVTMVKGTLLVHGKAVKEITLQDGTTLTAGQIKQQKNKITIEDKSVEREGKTVVGSVVKIDGKVAQGFTLNSGDTLSSRNECACVLPPIEPPRPDDTNRRRGTPHRTRNR